MKLSCDTVTLTQMLRLTGGLKQLAKARRDTKIQVLGLTGSLKQLVEARRDTIEKLQVRKTIV